MTIATAPGYALRSDRKTHQSAIAIQEWLSTPFARVLIPRTKRLQIEALMEQLAKRLAPIIVIEEAPDRPQLGSTVRLLSDSWFLREFHHAAPGALGEVVEYSRLSADDDGVLVNWGDGVSVRANLDELARV